MAWRLLSVMRGQETFRIVARELRPRLGTVAVLAALMVVGPAVGIVTPLIYKALIDTAIPSADISYIVRMLLLMLALQILQFGIGAMQDYRSISLGNRLAQALRKTLFDRLIRARIQDIDGVGTGELTNSVYRRAESICEWYVVGNVLTMGSNLLVLVGTLAVMTRLQWQLTLITLIALPLSFMMAARLGSLRKESGRAFYAIEDTIGSYVYHTVDGIRTIRAFGGERVESTRWKRLLSDHRSIRIRRFVVMRLHTAFSSQLIQNVTTGLVFGYGAYLVTTKEFTVGALVAFVAYVPKMYGALGAVLETKMDSEEIQADVEKTEALLSIPVERISEGSDLPLQGSNGVQVRFDDVTFHYSRGFGVGNLSFSVAPGEFVGIVGPSGGGKTTIIDLLMGFYAPESGRILVNDTDLQSLSLESLRRCIGLVPQNIHLWSGRTIRQNIGYPNDDADRSETRRAAQSAGIADFVDAQADGYEMVLPERDTGLSGGERQRFAIARAIMRQPQLLLMDEATSSLDSIAESEIRSSLETARSGRTTIVIAHRLATVINADRILVISGGSIVEQGAPADLLASRNLFYRLYEAQKLTLHEKIDPVEGDCAGTRPQ